MVHDSKADLFGRVLPRPELIARSIEQRLRANGVPTVARLLMVADALRGAAVGSCLVVGRSDIGWRHMIVGAGDLDGSECSVKIVIDLSDFAGIDWMSC